MTLDGVLVRTCSDTKTMTSNGETTEECTATYSIAPSSTPTNHLVEAIWSAFAQAMLPADIQHASENLIQELQQVEKQIQQAMIKAGDLKSSQGKSYTTPGGHTYQAHASDHIGIPATDLETQALKNNKTGGKGRATSFPDNATAQTAINFAIAHNAVLQRFILAAVPGSSIMEKVCDSSQDFGYGYQRNTLPNGTINPPTHFPHLHCALVWLAVDTSGNVFVVDAYPTIP
jgi:hypothetical protein